MTKANDNDIARLHRQGGSQAQIARQLGVSPSTVRRRMKKLQLPAGTLPSPDMERRVSLGLDALGQLVKINERANSVLDLLTFGPKRRLRQTIEEQVKETLDKYLSQNRLDGTKLPPIRFDFSRVTEDLKVALKAMAEIREQLKFHLDACKAVCDMQAAMEFEKAVLDAVGEVDPLVRRDIIQRLKEKRAAERPAAKPRAG
ncbi:MAG: helix-turn-helix domain-containing protein [Pseudomonadota bacterium]